MGLYGGHRRDLLHRGLRDTGWGVYWKRASKAGAYGAFICGFFTILGLKPVQQVFGVSWPSEVVGLVVAATACVVMFALSSLFPDAPKEEE
ncbi:MAG: hypothetical protein QM473_19055 [Acidobacteriota bacterium]|nr:hypothetical protein [Acidobacteriota bacterium]